MAPAQLMVMATVQGGPAPLSSGATKKVRGDGLNLRGHL